MASVWRESGGEMSGWRVVHYGDIVRQMCACRLGHAARIHLGQVESTNGSGIANADGDGYLRGNLCMNKLHRGVEPARGQRALVAYDRTASGRKVARGHACGGRSNNGNPTDVEMTSFMPTLAGTVSFSLPFTIECGPDGVPNAWASWGRDAATVLLANAGADRTESAGGMTSACLRPKTSMGEPCASSAKPMPEPMVSAKAEDALPSSTTPGADGAAGVPCAVWASSPCLLSIDCRSLGNALPLTRCPSSSKVPAATWSLMPPQRSKGWAALACGASSCSLEEQAGGSLGVCRQSPICVRGCERKRREWKRGEESRAGQRRGEYAAEQEDGGEKTEEQEWSVPRCLRGREYHRCVRQ
eukprot:scaffold53469_cov27-Tisochrysis_lutea.AAC.1